MHIIIMYTNQGQIQTFDKRGMARCVIIVDVRVAGICAAIVCKAHGHAKHANTKEVWGHAPRIFWKVTLPEIESEGIFNNLSPFNVSVDTGIQNILKYCYYLHAYIQAVIQLLFI